MNRQEKEKLVLELSKQGKTIREIAQIVHMSFGDICFIIRRETGEAEYQERMRMSKASQGLKLFEQGNTPVQVAIKLDMETREVDRLYREYWNLKGLHKLNEISAELKENIFSFVKLYRLTKKEGMTQQQVIDALKIAEAIPNLQAERQYIEDCIEDDELKALELKKRKMSATNELTSMLEELQSFGEYRDNELKSMEEEIASTREQTKFELNKQKESLDNEVDKYKASLARELKSLQVGIDNLKQEEQQLTCRIQRLNSEELEILRLVERQRRSKQQELYVQRGSITTRVSIPTTNTTGNTQAI